MKQLLTTLMLANAAVFAFGALQHAGVSIGPLHEPVIVPAGIVEIACALALVWGAVAVLRQSPKAWRSGLLGNLESDPQERHTTWNLDSGTKLFS
jgi:hypothetical protein